MLRYVPTRLENALCILFSYYACLLGMSSLRYNFVQSRYVQSRWIRIATLVPNVLTILVLPFALFHVYGRLDEDTLLHPLVTITNKISIGICFMAIVYTTVTRYSREKELIDFSVLWSRISTICNAWHTGPQPHIDNQFRQVFYLQCFINTYMLAYSICIFCVAYRSDPIMFSVTFFLANALNIVHTTVMVFNLSMMWLLRAFHYLHLELDWLRQRAANSGAQQQVVNELCLQLWRLQRVHFQLCGLVRRLNRIYHYPLLAARINNIVSLLGMGYMSLVIQHLLDGYRWLNLLMGLSYLVMLGQLYVTDALCDACALHARQAAQQLRSYSGLPFVNRQLRQRLNELALQLCCSELEITLCGMVVMDKRIMFHIFANAVSYTAVLVQFHIIMERQLEQAGKKVYTMPS